MLIPTVMLRLNRMLLAGGTFPSQFHLYLASELYLRYFHRVPKWNNKHAAQGRCPRLLLRVNTAVALGKGLI
jgi:hypothetical protein